uniref:Uncharacterized protein n=1 Tax=Rhizophora mucronata TaxID=61149 RepID=A0A2P2N368_RHIMU
MCINDSILPRPDDWMNPT